MKTRKVKIVRQRLHAQLAQQLARLRGVLAVGIDHGAKTARVVQAQSATRGDHLKVIVHARWRQTAGKAQTARHAQVQEQHAPVQVDQQVFATAAHRQYAATLQVVGVTAQRPTQGFAHMDGQHLGIGNMVGETQSRYFNFG